MKRFYTFILLLFTIFVFSQKTISGTIKNSEGENVPSASVTVEEPGSDAIIAYGISNSKGEYKVVFTSALSNVDLKIKAFNHKTQTRQVINQNQDLNFVLDTEATEIKEVKLKTKLITKKGDTISYDLKAFETKNDRTLADVIKNMPGMEVNKDGSILYQGQPLAKFYVNGKDLMEGSYGVITKSLPKDAVQKLEVMENHQPVKILQDKIASDQAAINIKLKNKVTMTGRGEIGLGIADPALWNVKLTPMFFGQKNQWVVNYKANNTGEAVENEGNMFAMGSRWEGFRRSTSQNEWLNVENASIPEVPEKRYLLNNVHFLSANLLTNPFKNKEWELKANASYTNNVIEREHYKEVNWFNNLGDSKENISTNFYSNKVKGELIFSKNAKKGFFKNTTTFTQFWNTDKANTSLASFNGTNTNQQSNQKVESPTSSFQNSLSTIIPWKEKMVNIQSFLSYQNDAQDLSLLPGSYAFYPEVIEENGVEKTINLFENVNHLNQSFNLKTFEANHSANVSFTKKFWTLTPEVGFNYTRNHLESNLFGDNSNFGSNFQNDLVFSNAIPYGSLRVNFKNESWQIFANFPANFNNIKAEDPSRNLSKSLSKITFEPNAFAQYSFASFWKASVSGSLNYNFGETESVYAGLILKSPRNIGAMNANNPIPETFSKSAGSRIEYRNPLNNLFFNVNYRLSSTERNLMASPIVTTLNYITSYIEQENTSNSRSFGAEIGKYFPSFKTNAAITYNNSVSTSEASQNTIVFESKNNAQTIGFKFNNSFLSWINADFNFNYSWNKQNTRDNTEVNFNKYNHNLAVYVYPIENHTVGFMWDQMNSKNEKSNYKNPFFDLSYQFAWTTKKVDFEVKLMNIANKKVFEAYSISAENESFTRMQLRPRQLLFTVKFNFK